LRLTAKATLRLPITTPKRNQGLSFGQAMTMKFAERLLKVFEKTCWYSAEFKARRFAGKESDPWSSSLELGTGRSLSR